MKLPRRPRRITSPPTELVKIERAVKDCLRSGLKPSEITLAVSKAIAIHTPDAAGDTGRRPGAVHDGP